MLYEVITLLQVPTLLSADANLFPDGERRNRLRRRLQHAAAALFQEFLCWRRELGARLQGIYYRSERQQR